jgi:hypothetical protein
MGALRLPLVSGVLKCLFSKLSIPNSRNFSLIICAGNLEINPWGGAVFCSREARLAAEIKKIPCIFPVNRELPAETGSYLTAHTTTQSSQNRKLDARLQIGCFCA